MKLFGGTLFMLPSLTIFMDLVCEKGRTMVGLGSVRGRSLLLRCGVSTAGVRAIATVVLLLGEE